MNHPQHPVNPYGTESTDMKIKLDRDVDALYFRLDESRIVDSEEVRPGVILDYDENDQVVGIEFLNVSSRVAEAELALMQFQTA
jgi:uncharacterized protein YuzE